MAKTPEEQLGVPLPEEPEVVLPTQTSPPEPEENVEAKDDRPDWLPSKFKSGEDLARSYSELESKLGEQGKTISELQAQMEQQQYVDPSQYWQNDDDYLNQLFEENPREAVALTVQQQLQEMQRQAWQAQQQYQQQNQPFEEGRRATEAEIIADVTARHMEDKYEDWGSFQERAQQILQDRTIPQQDLFNLPVFERHVEEAYKLAKYEALTGQENELRSQGYSQEEFDRLRKEQAQTLTARRSSPREQLEPDQQKALELIAARQNAGKPPWY